MKKIAIVTRHLSIGGIEKALVEMLRLIKDEYEIDLYVIDKKGEFKKFIPKSVNIIDLHGEEKSIYKKIIKNILKLNFLEIIKLLYNTIIFKKVGNNRKGEEYLLNLIPKIKKKYDVSIAYSTPASFCNKYAIQNLESNKKIIWIHSDINIFKDDIERYNYKKYYEKYDQINCISKEMKEKFLKIYPEFSNKTKVFYNVIDEENIQTLSKDNSFLDFDYKETRILTIGRLSPEKGQMKIPQIMIDLLKSGYKVKWYLIGEGSIRKTIEREIELKGLKEFIILLGSKENPYPYLKDCDLYVQLSDYEGYCTTIEEAKVLKKTIISTNYLSIHEQLKHNETGLIIENKIELIQEAIKRVLDDESLKKKLIKNLEKDSSVLKKYKFNF